MKKSKKTFKRVLAVALATLMFASSLPIISFADVTADMAQLEQAINGYEVKMDGTIYTGMKPAYDEYIKALKIRDAYKYGGKTTVDAANVATRLAGYTRVMEPWDGSKLYTLATKTSFEGDTATENYKEGTTHSNLIYMSSCTAAAPSGEALGPAGNGKSDLSIRIYYPTSIAVYDGVNPIKVPVMYSGANQSNNGDKDKRFIYGIYPDDNTNSHNDSADFSLPSYWKGPTATSPDKMDFSAYIADASTAGSGYSKATTDNATNQNRGPVLPGRWRQYIWNNYSEYPMYQANTLEVNCNLTDSEFTKTYASSTWYSQAAGQNNLGDANFKKSITANTPIYVLNVKSLIDAVENKVTTQFSLADVEKVTIESNKMSTLLGAVDAVTGFNINNTYKFNANIAQDVANAAKDIEAKTNAVNSAAIPTVDAVPNGYTNLRTAMDKAKTAYNSNGTGYTAETFGPFKTSYDAAKTHMTNLDNNKNSTGYGANAEAQKLADDLSQKLAALDTNIPKVDTKLLQDVIDNANVTAHIKNFLKASDTATKPFETGFADLQAAIKLAKEQVWGGNVANYGDKSKALDESPENQAIVTQHVAAIGNALKEIAFNFDAKLPKANNKSMNELIAESQTLVALDYANFATVESAVADAQSFMAQGNTFKSERGNVKTMVMNYVDKTVALNIAIKNLQPSFAKIKNGTVIDKGTIVNTHIENDGTKIWQFNNEYQNNMVFFRTDHQATVFDLGNATISLASYKKYDQVLDSINIDDKANSVPTGGNTGKPSSSQGEITSNSKPMTPEQIAALPGNLKLNATTNNITGVFEFSDIYVSSTSSNKQGVNLQGTTVGTNESYNWTADLASTEGVFNPTKGIVAPPYSVANGERVNEPTQMRSNYTFTLPTSTAASIFNGSLTSSTIPFSSTYAPQGAYMGVVMQWHYSPTFATEYQGYGHQRTLWEPKVTIVDISYLMDLGRDCADIIANHSSEYTAASIKALQAALNKANADLNYGTMSADAITQECVTRYNNLWTAYSNLQKEHVHQWGEPVFKINSNTGALESVIVTCKLDSAHTQDLTQSASLQSKTEITPPTATDKGVNRYTYQVTFNGQTYTGYQDVADIPATGIKYSLISATPNQDYSQVEFVLESNEVPAKQTKLSVATKSRIDTPATCIAKGTTVYTATLEFNSQTFNYESTPIENIEIDSTNHTAKVEHQYDAPTEANGYIGHSAGITCSACDTDTRTVIDANAYIAAQEQANATKSDPSYNKKFDQADRDKFEQSIKNNTIDLNQPTTQDALNNAATGLSEANTVINSKAKFFTVKVQAIVNDAPQKAQDLDDNVLYGTPFTVDATELKGTGYVSNWEIVDQLTNGSTKVYSAMDTIDFTVTSDTLVKVYIADKPTDGKNYTKVTLYNQFNKVYNVSYVLDTSSIDLSQEVLMLNGNPVKAPTVPFYKFSNWAVKSSPSGEYNLAPQYTFIENSASYSQINGVNGAMVNGVTQLTSKYDSLVTLTGGEAYAIVSDASASKVITYLSGSQMHVPHNAKVFVAVVDKAMLNTATSGITGALVIDKAEYGLGKKAATFNCAFNLPADATLIECGAIGTIKSAVGTNENDFVIGNTGVVKFKSDRHSFLNEYSIEFISRFAPNTTFYGRSYIVYKDSTGEHTIYGNVAELAL